ncbi:MAG: amidohydrolase family protein [Clostridiales bacterium]|jgi:predicted TIM-barrel fold metal-dependent hydrolase|nr:amidohydrolase family protein [Clostridiales bacterium]
MPEVSCCGSKYEIIDTHAHVYPEKISLKAARNIGRFYGVAPHHNGSVKELISKGRKNQVDGYLICSVATSPDQVCAINDFIASECKKHSEFYGFGALHPDMENIGEEIERIIALGLKGVKLHPDFQRFNIDSKKAYEIYDIVAGRLPILMHMGDSRYDYSSPQRLARVLKDFRNLRIIAAHLGGYRVWDIARQYLKHHELKFDTSSAQALLSPEQAREQIRYLGAENCFFGTDYPLWDYGKEIEAFFRLGLTDEENSMILAENFKRFISE